MRFVIVTGMSGAGKTSVLKFLEDINFFCVDNLPPALLPKFAELYGMPLDTIIAMGAEINGSIHNVTSFVMICVAPLNVVKGIMVSILTMLLYKRVARPLFGIHR